MSSLREARVPAGSPIPALRDDTRRALLAKAGLVAGAATAVGLASPTTAPASHDPNLDFEGFLNVKHFGAVGDGSSIDKQAIQDCIDEAAATPGGRTVYIPPGEYLIDEPPLELWSGTRLLGHGPLTVLKRGAGTGGTIIREKAEPEVTTNVVIENLTLDGNRGAPSQTAFLINFVGEQIYIRGVEGRNCGTSFSFNLNVKHAVIEDCYVHGGGSDGINVEGEDIVIRGNLVRDCEDDHIVVLTQNTLTPNTRISIVGNICESFADDPMPTGGAIVARGGGLQDSVIAGNVCSGGPQAGIVLNAIAGPITDVSIANNVILDAGGLQPQQGASNGSGIVIQATASFQDVKRVKVVENVIVAPNNHGVMVVRQNAQVVDTGSVSDLLIARNTIAMGPKDSQSEGRSGIWCVAPEVHVNDVRIADNDIRDATGPGIVATRSSDPDGDLRRWDVCGNRILNSGSQSSHEPAIQLDGIDDVSVTGNRAHDAQEEGKTQSRGLVATDLRGSVIVAGNTFTDNTETVGISLGNLGGAIEDVRLRDNPTFNPWVGEEQLGGWVPMGSQYVSQDIAVTFAVPFPIGKPVPHIVSTVRPASGTVLNVYAVVKSLSHTGFFLGAISDTDPGAHPHKVAWRAEPSA